MGEMGFGKDISGIEMLTFGNMDDDTIALDVRIQFLKRMIDRTCEIERELSTNGSFSGMISFLISRF